MAFEEYIKELEYAQTDKSNTKTLPILVENYTSIKHLQKKIDFLMKTIVFL